MVAVNTTHFLDKGMIRKLIFVNDPQWLCLLQTRPLLKLS